MPTYLLQGSYTSEGAKGLAKDGGSKRQATVKEMVEKSGGTLKAFYFALGEADVYTIVELPDTATAVAMSLAVNTSGAVNLKTVALLSPEEFDAAAKKSIGYRPPGA